MAVISIANALCVGKGVFDRPAILRAEHAGARHRLSANLAWRSYRQAFADALRREWQTAKFAAAQVAFNAEEADLPPLPADIVTLQPHTFAGHTRFRALNDEAHEIALAAQLNMIPAKDRSHHAC